MLSFHTQNNKKACQRPNSSGAYSLKPIFPPGPGAHTFLLNISVSLLSKAEQLMARKKKAPPIIYSPQFALQSPSTYSVAE